MAGATGATWDQLWGGVQPWQEPYDGSGLSDLHHGQQWLQGCKGAHGGLLIPSARGEGFWEWSQSAHGPCLPSAPSHNSQIVPGLGQLLSPPLSGGLVTCCPGLAACPFACTGCSARGCTLPEAFPDCRRWWAPRSTRHTVSHHCLPQGGGRLKARPRVPSSLWTLSRHHRHSPPTPAQLSWEKLVPSWPQ